MTSGAATISLESITESHTRQITTVPGRKKTEGQHIPEKKKKRWNITVE